MAYKRREGLAGGGITKFMDTNVSVCPCCGSKRPYWLTDAYIAKYSLISSQCLNGYKFMCSSCNAEIEIQGNTDFCFQTKRFATIRILRTGNGTLNKEYVGRSISFTELCNLSRNAGLGTNNETLSAAPKEVSGKITVDELKNKIIHLKEMLDQGLISEEEFNQIKSDLLSKL